MTSSNKTWDWEKEFEELDFIHMLGKEWDDKIKSFIHQVAEQAREEGYEEGKRDEELKRNIEGLEHNRIFQKHLEKEKEQARLDERKRLLEMINERFVKEYTAENQGWNQALDFLKSKLEKE